MKTVVNRGGVRQYQYAPNIAILAAAGFVSGILSPEFPPSHSWQAALFAAAITATLWLACGIRSARLFFLFLVILASYSLAWVSSFFGALSSGLFFPSESWESRNYGFHMYLIGGIVGGFVGSAVIIGAFYLLFYPRQGARRWLLITTLWSLAGGIFAAFGVALDIDPDHSGLPFVVAVWEAGMGAVLGAIIWCEERRSLFPTGSTPRASSLSSAFINWAAACLLAILSCLRVGQLIRFHNAALVRAAATVEAGRRSAERVAARDREIAEHRKQEIARSIADAPALQASMHVTELPPEKVLILPAIDDFVAQIPTAHVMPSHMEPGLAGYVEPSFVLYEVGYEEHGSSTDSDRQALVTVRVNQYPNADWARYELRNTPSPNMGIWSSSPQQEERSNSQIWQYQDSGRQAHYWASKDKIILVYCDPAGQIVLDSYLKRYPSSPVKPWHAR